MASTMRSMVPALILSCVTCSSGSANPLQGVADLVESTLPSVVSITTVDPEMNDGIKEEDLGTGFFISEDGNIITNYHVVKNSSTIYVSTSNGERLLANVIGADEESDIAILDVEGSQHPMISFGDSEGIRIGDAVVAIGSPFGLSGSVSLGIISGKNRKIDDSSIEGFLQTDAAINLGSSGGPLFNAKGEVVGVNTALFSQTGGSVGIGFAIPSTKVLDIIENIQDSEVKLGYIGVHDAPINTQISKVFGLPEGIGRIVMALDEQSPSSFSLFDGDIITKVDDEVIFSDTPIGLLISDKEVGKSVMLEVVRDGSVILVEVEVVQSPSGEQTLEPQFKFNTDKNLLSEFGLLFEGSTITKVLDGTQASASGFKLGDEIVKIGQAEFKESSQFELMIRKSKPFLVKVSRENNLLFIAVN